MGAIAGEELSKWEKMQGGVSGAEEKILVLLRLRPLSDKEISANESADWECINDTTILYRNTLREGSTFPSAYTFGKELISILNLHFAFSFFFKFVYTLVSFLVVSDSIAFYQQWVDLSANGLGHLKQVVSGSISDSCV